MLECRDLVSRSGAALAAREAVLMPTGRPPLYPSLLAARRAANARTSHRALAAGLIQRSVALPEACWSIIRAVLAADEISEAQTLTRLLLQKG